MLSPALRFTSELLSEVGFGSSRKMENHILQFQPDRFIANWKRHRNPQQYPRFEGIARLSLMTSINLKSNSIQDLHAKSISIRLRPATSASFLSKIFRKRAIGSACGAATV